jgi:DNA-binding HxlR family transcriptional regulator
MKVLQKKGSVLIPLTYQVLNKERLRRSELSTALGTKISREKGGLLSDKTLDLRLEEFTKKKFLESETDYSDYPPAKYYQLTEKGKKIVKTMNKLVDQL